MHASQELAPEFCRPRDLRTKPPAACHPLPPSTPSNESTPASIHDSQNMYHSRYPDGLSALPPSITSMIDHHDVPQSYNTSITAVITPAAHPTILALISAPALSHGVCSYGTRLPSTVLFAFIHTNSTLVCTRFESGSTNRPSRTTGIVWRVKRSYVSFAGA